MGAVRHLAGPDAIAEDVGLTRAQFDRIVRLATSLRTELEDNELSTLDDIAREAGVTTDQGRYVWLAWVRTDQHPAGGR